MFQSTRPLILCLVAFLTTQSIALDDNLQLPKGEYVLIDITDPGTDVDDTVALLHAFQTPSLRDRLALIVSSDEVEGNKRARLIQHLLKQSNLTIPLAVGENLGHTNFLVDDTYLGDGGGLRADYLRAMHEVILEAGNSEKNVIIHSHGGFTELANFLKAHPNDLEHITAVVQMGGSFLRGEYNVKRDLTASDYVIKTIPNKLFLVTVDTTASSDLVDMKPGNPFMQSVSQTAHGPLLTHSLEKFLPLVAPRYTASKPHDLLSLSVVQSLMEGTSSYVRFQHKKISVDLLTGKLVENAETDQNILVSIPQYPAEDFYKEVMMGQFKSRI